MAVPTKKQIAGAQRRSLRAMHTKLLDMASAWEDVDQCFVSFLTEAAEKVLDVHVQLQEDVEEQYQ